MADFSTWQRESVERLATELTVKVIEQNAVIGTMLGVLLKIQRIIAVPSPASQAEALDEIERQIKDVITKASRINQ